mgnify:CR=1 FL=1
MKVDKELLKREKMIYGDNFEPVCERWSKYSSFWRIILVS